MSIEELDLVNQLRIDKAIGAIKKFKKDFEVEILMNEDMDDELRQAKAFACYNLEDRKVYLSSDYWINTDPYTLDQIIQYTVEVTKFHPETEYLSTGVVLHELFHALEYQISLSGFPEILEETEKVYNMYMHDPKTNKKQYAATNPREFFAEKMLEYSFGQKDKYSESLASMVLSWTESGEKTSFEEYKEKTPEEEAEEKDKKKKERIKRFVSSLSEEEILYLKNLLNDPNNQKL